MFKYVLAITLITQVSYSANNNALDDYHRKALDLGDEGCYKKILNESFELNKYSFYYHDDLDLFRKLRKAASSYGHIKTLSYSGLCSTLHQIDLYEQEPTLDKLSKDMIVVKNHLQNFIKHGGEVKDLILPVRIAAGVPHTSKPLRMLLYEGLPVSYAYKNEHDEHLTEDSISEAIEFGHPDNITMLLRGGSSKKFAIKSLNYAEKYLDKLAICAPGDHDRIMRECEDRDDCLGSDLVKHPERKIAVEKGLWSEDRRAWIKVSVATSHARYKPAVVSKKPRVEIVE